MTEKQNQSSTSMDENWQYTRCPDCQAVFRIDQSKLLVRKGEVRCGSCRVVFHAPSNIVYRDGDGRFSSLLAKPVADDEQTKQSKQDAHRLAVRAKMGLESGPSLGTDLSAAYLNRPRSDEANLELSKPQESVDAILKSFNQSSQTSVLDTLETDDDQPDLAGPDESESTGAEPDIAQPVFTQPLVDQLETTASDFQESIGLNRNDLDATAPNINSPYAYRPTAPDSEFTGSLSEKSEFEGSESREQNELDLQSIRSAHLESFAEPAESLKEPTFGEPLDGAVNDIGLFTQPSISPSIRDDDAVEDTNSQSRKTPIQIDEEEENFDASILTNTVDDSSEMVELVIPKISSESLVNRQFEGSEDRRLEPVISIESETETVPRISVDSNLKPELEKDAVLPSGFASVEASNFESLSEIEQHDEPQLKILAAEDFKEVEKAVDADDEPVNEIELSEIDSLDANAQSQTAMSTPPRFEPFIPPPPSLSEAENASEELTDNWKVKDDSLLDHNPFSPKFEATESRVEEVTEIKIDSRPAAINMSGVDEYIVDRPNPLAGVFWSLVSVAFVVLLGLQVKYFLVERFAQHEAYRPYLQVFCKMARCELSPRRDAYRFTITQTRVDLHPQEPGALRITVRLLNQADFSQPYPELRLTLTDRVGRVVGRRKFDPDFYLQKGVSSQLASGELGYVVFDLASPHEKAVGFVVDVVRRSI